MSGAAETPGERGWDWSIPFWAAFPWDAPHKSLISARNSNSKQLWDRGGIWDGFPGTFPHTAEHLWLPLSLLLLQLRVSPSAWPEGTFGAISQVFLSFRSRELIKVLAGASFIGGFEHLMEVKVGEQTLSSPQLCDLHILCGTWDCWDDPRLLHPQGILMGSKILDLWESLNATFDSSGKHSTGIKWSIPQQGNDLC